MPEIIEQINRPSNELCDLYANRYGRYLQGLTEHYSQWAQYFSDYNPNGLVAVVDVTPASAWIQGQSMQTRGGVHFQFYKPQPYNPKKSKSQKDAGYPIQVRTDSNRRSISASAAELNDEDLILASVQPLALTSGALLQRPRANSLEVILQEGDDPHRAKKQTYQAPPIVKATYFFRLRNDVMPTDQEIDALWGRSRDESQLKIYPIGDRSDLYRGEEEV